MLLRAVCLLLALTSSICFAADNQEITKNLARLFPGVPLEQPVETAVKGIYEVQVTGSREKVYLSADGRYMIQGKLLDIQGDQPVDIDALRLRPVRAAAVAKINRDDTIVYKAKGVVRDTLYVFTDISCGYCRKLHHEINDLNDQGIEVVYLAFPRDAYAAGKFKASMENIWCAVDRKAAMDEGFKSGYPAIRGTKPCAAPVMQQHNLGVQLGVQATPAIISSKGVFISGFAETPALLKRLGIAPIS